MTVYEAEGLMPFAKEIQILIRKYPLRNKCNFSKKKKIRNRQYDWNIKNSQTLRSYISRVLLFVRSEVLTTVLLKSEVFLDVMLCHSVNISPIFEACWCLHVEGQAVKEEWAT